MNRLAGRPDPEQQLIDRLVDGELSESERRQFLGSLDEDPAQWRRVALSFIESQCCLEAFGAITQPADSETPCCAPLVAEQPPVSKQQQHEQQQQTEQQQQADSPKPAAADRQQQQTQQQDAAAASSRQRGWVFRALPVVASVAVAFSLGFIAQSRWSEWAERASRPLSTSRHTQGIPIEPIANAIPRVAGSEHAGGVDVPLRKVKLPLILGSDSTENWLSHSDRVVSPELEQSLYRYGHLVSEQRRVYRVQLKDGRQILVPVKEIELKFVGNRGYQ